MKKDKLTGLYNEPVTKDKLLQYLKQYILIEIVPLKKDEPIFILKESALTEQEQWGCPDKIVIHKGNFILPRRTIIRTPNYTSFPSGIKYLNKFKEKYPSKEFLIQSILDKQVKSEAKYITPIREFFRKYEILSDLRGKIKRKYEGIIKERAQETVKAYKEICKITKRKKPLPIKSIKEKLDDYVIAQGYPADSKEAKIFDVSDATIRRTIKSNIKKIFF